jgi:hypothetical protein
LLESDSDAAGEKRQKDNTTENSQIETVRSHHGVTLSSAIDPAYPARQGRRCTPFYRKAVNGKHDSRNWFGGTRMSSGDFTVAENSGIIISLLSGTCNKRIPFQRKSTPDI